MGYGGNQLQLKYRHFKEAGQGWDGYFFLANLFAFTHAEAFCEPRHDAEGASGSYEVPGVDPEVLSSGNLDVLAFRL